MLAVVVQLQAHKANIKYCSCIAFCLIRSTQQCPDKGPRFTLPLHFSTSLWIQAAEGVPRHKAKRHRGFCLPMMSMGSPWTVDLLCGLFWDSAHCE